MAEGAAAIYGANGFTGSRSARELARRGVPLILAGRNLAALDALAEELREASPSVETRRLELGDAAGMRRLVGDAGVILNNVPLFVDTGPPMVAAAIEAGTHYLDTSAEQRFLHALLQGPADRAAEAGVALLPGFAYTHALGDMLAHLAAAGFGAVDEVALGYFAKRWVPTEGTIRARLDGVVGTWFTYDGALRPTTAVQRPDWFEFPAPIGRRRVVPYPLCEVFSVPMHVDVDRVRTLLNVESVVDPRVGRLYRPVTALARAAMRTPARRLVERVMRTQSGLATVDDPSAFTIVARARAGGRTRTAGLRADEIYSFTAVVQAEAAQRALDPGFRARGLPAPAQAFEPAAFLDALCERAGRQYGVRWWVDESIAS